MNFPKPTSQQIEDFARRVMVALPDSVEMQKADLAVLVKLLPDSKGRKAAMAILSCLIAAENAQREFCFADSTPNNGGK